MRKLTIGLFLICLGGLGKAQSPCSATADHIIATYMKGTTPADRARLRQAFSTINKVDPPALTAFEKVIVDDLASAPVEELSGVANPKHWLRATSGWTNDPALVQRYVVAIDFLRNADGKLKPGLALQASTPRSTTNIRRVAGGGGSKAEAWEAVSAHEMVAAGWFTKDEVAEFGLKVDLTGGGQVEADVWVLKATGETWLLDQKHTAGDLIESIDSDLIARWIRGLSNGDFDRVLIPTNKPPDPALVTRIRNALAANTPPLPASKIDFVANLNPF